MKIPVSLLSTYLYCPRKVFLERVLRLREPPRQPLVLGTIRHQALEEAAKAEEALVSSEVDGILSYDDILEIYKAQYLSLLRDVVQRHVPALESLGMDPLDAYHRALPTLLREAETRTANLHRCMDSTKLAGRQLWDALTPKIRSEVAIDSDELHLTGIVDQIHETGDSMIPVELKTGKMPREGVWPGHRVQAAAYALLVGERYGKAVPHAIVHYLDANEKRMIPMNPFMKDEIRMLVGEIMELMDNRLMPEFCSSRQKCAACGLKRQCYDSSLMDSLIVALREKVVRAGTPSAARWPAEG